VSAVIIDGKSIAAEIRSELAGEIVALTKQLGRAPSLRVVLCGPDPASQTYVRMKAKACAAVGIDFELLTPPADSTTAGIAELVRSLNDDDGVDSMLVQLPLHAQIDEKTVVETIDPAKDADCLHPYNLGRLVQGNEPPTLPCTPAGCMELLRRSGVEISGADAVVIGRSNIVGRPLAALLTNASATVTVCHSRTRDLPSVCARADILVAAIGKPGMIGAEYVKPGACVVDVGITPVEGKVLGDIDRASVEPVAGWLTPVPGGVGPMTVAMLMRNTVKLARTRNALQPA
jgi:methylenetetrahydrofolate dehydrogenase (NADP+) / methenyltetrahydrofolate cyclohydrolase